MERINPDIYHRIEQNNGMITTEEVLAMGHSKQLLCNYSEAGLLKRVQHGLYALPNSDIEFDGHFLIMCRSPHIVFSHASAQYLAGLRKEPFRFYITLPNNKMMPASIKTQCDAYYVKPEWHKIGLTEYKTKFGYCVRCYDAERTLCDFVRARARTIFKEGIQEDIFEAIRYYLHSDEIDIQNLNEYANIFGIKKKMKNYILQATEKFMYPDPRPESIERFEENLRNILFLFG